MQRHATITVLTLVGLLAFPGLVAEATDAGPRPDRTTPPTTPGPQIEATPLDGIARGIGPGPDRPVGPPIHNQVLDLLDEEVFLDSSGETYEWVSAPFDTSRFNRLLYRTTSAIENGSVICTPEWQYTADDAFLPGGPTLTFIGDDRNPRPTYPNGLPSSPVLGLRARIRCELFPGPIGTSDPLPATGTLSDVKVLLRRE